MSGPHVCLRWTGGGSWADTRSHAAPTGSRTTRRSGSEGGLHCFVRGSRGGKGGFGHRQGGGGQTNTIARRDLHAACDGGVHAAPALRAPDRIPIHPGSEGPQRQRDQHREGMLDGGRDEEWGELAAAPQVQICEAVASLFDVADDLEAKGPVEAGGGRDSGCAGGSSLIRRRMGRHLEGNQQRGGRVKSNRRRREGNRRQSEGIRRQLTASKGAKNLSTHNGPGRGRGRGRGSEGGRGRGSEEDKGGGGAAVQP